MNFQDKENDMYIQAQKQNRRCHICVTFLAAVMILFMVGCATTSPPTDTTDVSKDRADKPIPEKVEAQKADIGSSNAEVPDEGSAQSSSLTGARVVSNITFPTFLDTGLDICTNDEGRPLIYLFSSSTCPHCKWGGGAYDFIVRYFASNGLVEAHHYELDTGDDLLTEETETEIPADKLELYHSGDPKDLVPYYNFGCKFDRVGNGYERKDDLAAEGEEMRNVIETLLKLVPKDK